MYASSGYGYGLPKAVKYLLISNVAVFIVTSVLPVVFGVYFPFNRLFGLIPDYITHHFMIWQFFTYMYLHGGLAHIGFNLFALWMFGTELEYNWGARDFFKFYTVCGIGGGVLVWLVSFTSFGDPYISTIGASGAIFGLLVAYGLMWPDRLILLFGILPMKALHFVIIFAAIDLYYAVTGTGGNVAYFAHIGGGLTGFIYLKYGWRIMIQFENLSRRLKRRKFTVIDGGKGRSNSHDELYKDMDDEVNRILDKISKSGIESLDDRERRILERASKRGGKM
ncbi:MAG: rhomboid family intramembrane serine protease [Candidatus Latescibacterota bacterium]